MGAGVLLGTVAAGAAPATAGLFGTAGAFGFAQTFSTLSTVFSAVSSLSSGAAQGGASEFNAAVARNNAILARQSAAVNAEREKRLGRKRLGALRAGIGASGITLEGTPLDLIADSASEEELNRLTALHGGDIEARGFEQTATLETARGRQARRRGFFGAGSALLLGAGRLTGGGGSSTPRISIPGRAQAGVRT